MLTDLRLQNFRSYLDGSFELDSGVNIIVGPNASGKTNLLEAVLVLSRGTSYRAKDSDLIYFNKNWSRIDCDLVSGGHRTVKLNLETRPEKTYEINDKVFKRLTHSNRVPVVLFEPNHLQLLSGSPERRRDYLDELLEQLTPDYSGVSRRYRRTLAQRNALLKQNKTPSQNQLFPWNIRLSELAGQIVRARSDVVSRINTESAPLYKSISNSKSELRFTYNAMWPIESYQSHLLKKLESNLENDHMRGFTLFGPHREDMLTELNGHTSQEVASRGESRSIVLVLKLTELKLVQDFRQGESPILLLDDVFSELDGKRRHALTDYLSNYQTFITTTDADIVLKHFANKCNLIALGKD